MSGISILPSGKLPDQLVNNSLCISIKNENVDSSKPEVVGKKIQLNQDRYERIQNEVTKAIREGKVTDLSKHFSSSNQSNSDTIGKTVVDNTHRGGLVVKPLYDENGNSNFPTNNFLEDSLDFLMEAAKEYATLGENEVFKYRAISDHDFVRHTLDFFTGGNYTDGDIVSVQKQMTTVVNELAQQIKDGKAPDLTKLESKLTIGEANVTIGQLVDFQKIGKELKDSYSASAGSLNGYLIGNFAKIGMAETIGKYIGNENGEIGQMFSSAMERLSQNCMAEIQKNINSPMFNGKQWSKSDKETVDLGTKIKELFSNLDTSNKENFSKAFDSQITQTRTLVQDYCKKYGVSTAHVGLTGATADITKYFQGWMTQLT